MGPGSFGTGKRAARLIGLELTKRLQWGPVHLEPGRSTAATGRLAGERLRSLLQWGPVHLEPGRRLPVQIPLTPVHLASMGPGSFGTGKSEQKATDRKKREARLQWGPVHLEPGSPHLADETWVVRIGFNGARFIWNREATITVVPVFASAELLQWGPVHLEPGSPGEVVRHPWRPPERASMGPGSFGTGKGDGGGVSFSKRYGHASMGPGSFGTGKLRWARSGASRLWSCFNGARFIWNREGKGLGGLLWAEICFNGARFIWNREARRGPSSRGST